MSFIIENRLIDILVLIFWPYEVELLRLMFESFIGLISKRNYNKKRRNRSVVYYY